MTQIKASGGETPKGTLAPPLPPEDISLLFSLLHGDLVAPPRRVKKDAFVLNHKIHWNFLQGLFSPIKGGRWRLGELGRRL